MPEVADLLRSARQALSREEPGRALPLLQEAVSMAPESFDGRMLLAVCLWMCGRHQEGLSASQLAVDLCPQRAEGHYNLGVMLQAAGRLEEATEHFRTALELNPDYPRAAEGLMTLGVPPERQSTPAAAGTGGPVEEPSAGDAGEAASGPTRPDESAPAEDTTQTGASERSDRPASDWHAMLLEALKDLGPDST